MEKEGAICLFDCSSLHLRFKTLDRNRRLSHSWKITIIMSKETLKHYGLLQQFKSNVIPSSVAKDGGASTSKRELTIHGTVGDPNPLPSLITTLVSYREVRRRTMRHQQDEKELVVYEKKQWGISRHGPSRRTTCMDYGQQEKT